MRILDRDEQILHTLLSNGLNNTTADNILRCIDCKMNESDICKNTAYHFLYIDPLQFEIKNLKNSYSSLSNLILSEFDIVESIGFQDVSSEEKSLRNSAAKSILSYIDQLIDLLSDIRRFSVEIPEGSEKKELNDLASLISGDLDTFSRRYAKILEKYSLTRSFGKN